MGHLRGWRWPHVVFQTTCGPPHFQRSATRLLAVLCRTSRFAESAPGGQRDPSRILLSRRHCGRRHHANPPRAHLSPFDSCQCPTVSTKVWKIGSLISKSQVRRKNMSPDNTKIPPLAISVTHARSGLSTLENGSDSGARLPCLRSSTRRRWRLQDGRPIEAREAARRRLQNCSTQGCSSTSTSRRCGAAGPRAGSSVRSARDRGSCRQPCWHPDELCRILRYLPDFASALCGCP